MEMRRKGFVYTLESVIASTLIISVIITAIPQTSSENPSMVQERAYNGLESLEMGGKLGENPDADEVEKKLDPYIPPGFNFSVELTKLEKNSGSLTAPATTDLQDRNRSRLLLWIEPQTSVNVSLNETTLVENLNTEKYVEFDPKDGGELRIEGSGGLRYVHQWTKLEGTEVAGGNIYTTNFLRRGNSSQEVTVRIWEE